MLFYPNKAGIFEGNFFWEGEGQFGHPSFIFQEELI